MHSFNLGCEILCVNNSCCGSHELLLILVVTFLHSWSAAIQNHREVISITGNGKKKNKLQMKITETEPEDNCDSRRKALCTRVRQDMMDVTNSSIGSELE
jgi:hypothetical protein